MTAERTALFDRYLNEELSLEERKNFEKRLTADADFQQDFALYQDLQQTLVHHFSAERQEFINTLTGARESTSADTAREIQPKKRRFGYWSWAIAATILVVAGLFLFTPSTPTYRDYAPTQHFSIDVRGENNTLLSKAAAVFNQADYSKALTYFDRLLAKDSTAVNLQYYKAVSLLELNQFQEADLLLTKITKGPSVFASNAQWMLALSQLKQGKYAAVKRQLQKITSDSPFYERAQQLLNAL